MPSSSAHTAIQGCKDLQVSQRDQLRGGGGAYPWFGRVEIDPLHPLGASKELPLFFDMEIRHYTRRSIAILRKRLYLDV